MGLMQNEHMFKKMTFPTADQETIAPEDRQKIPRIIKGGQISTHSPDFGSFDTLQHPDFPLLRVHKTGEVIDSIELRCACGQILKLAFDYKT